ncbi:MAG: TIGR04283 family arsenosugar biosynthesis glycosyltransferase [Methylococcales bacterium]|nr:TIGR04283 family arsenosugar biosynthesis glycosyltransferase [Methylococcales bacterium]
MQYSMIIPTLNEADNIEACLLALQSIRPQCEVIVVDGGSFDNTLQIARLLADKVLSSDKGRAKQMNIGAKQAMGEMLIFLHADTFLPANALTLIGQTCETWGRFDIQLQGKSYGLSVVSALMNIRSRLTSIATGDQVIFVHRQLFDSIDGYPDIALMEDISLSAQLKKITPPICLREKVISSGRRWEKFGVFKTILLMWGCRLRYFFGESPDVLSTLYSRGQFWKQS